MATIEFLNQETETYFHDLIEEERKQQEKLKRMVYLVRAGLVWEAC
jgi:hypothetical protein